MGKGKSVCRMRRILLDRKQDNGFKKNVCIPRITTQREGMMQARHFKSVLTAVLFGTLLWANLGGQGAEITESFLPDSGLPDQVKQGSDGNLYMVCNVPQGVDTLPFHYISFGIVNPEGDVVHYYTPDESECQGIGWEAYHVFCLDPDNSFRIPYYRAEYDSNGVYATRFKWCRYQPGEGFSFTTGYTLQGSITGYFTDVVRINNDRWIITKRNGSDATAVCVNAAGDSLWSYQYWGQYFNPRWVKRISDDRILMAHQFSDLMMKAVVFDQNGEQIWQYQDGAGGNPPHISHVYLGDYYTDDRAIVAYDYCSGENFVFEYYDNTLTQLFEQSYLSLWHNPTASCDLNGFLFSQPGNDYFRKYDIAGNLEWEYALPDSFWAPRSDYQVINVPSDSCYIAIGLRFLGVDWEYMVSMFSPYFIKLPYNLTANDDNVAPPVSGLAITVYPNPFRSDVMIALNARQSQKVEIDIYNIKGQLVRRLERFYAKSGENLQNWDGRDNLGDSVAPGLYLIKAKSGSQRVTQKCLRF